ncbi:hypothetical protein EJ103_05730 [Pseudoalteromonas sp. Xi13]|nr:hypothetical protein EJ103_05730 [Pseudoalteromonas sp. Xi13]TMP84680.1 hypothetical protein CWB71_01930 [Pseudoalteromonas sp. S983]
MLRPVYYRPFYYLREHMQSQGMSFQDVSNLILKEINNNNFLKALKIANSIKSNESSIVAHLHHLKSIAYQKKKDYILCLAEIEKGIKLSPRHFHLNVNKAKLYNLLGEPDKSIKQYLNVLTIYSDDIETLYNISVLYFKKNEFTKAKEYIDKAFTLSPQNAVILSAKIKTDLKLEKFTEVDRLTDDYIRNFGADASILNSKGLALKALCFWDKAIITFEQSLKLSPGLVEAKKNMASCYHLAGKFKKAKAIYTELTTINPLDLDSHHWLNQMLWETADSGFLSSYNHALKITGKNTALEAELAQKLYTSGKQTEAYKIAKQILSQSNCPQKAFSIVGDYERENSLFDESLETHLAASNRFKNNHAYIELAKSYIAIDKPDHALNIINKLLNQDEYNQEYLCIKNTALRLLKSELYSYYCNYDLFVMQEKIATPSGFASIDDFLTELKGTLKQYHYYQNHPLEQSLVNGSQTAEKLFDYQLPILKILKQELYELTSCFLSRLPKDNQHPFLKRNVGDFKVTDSWSVILKGKGFHKNHYHSQGWMSSPFYVSIPTLISESTNQEGWLKLGEPGFNMNTKLLPETTLKPEEGKLIQFPSYFWHGTNTLNSEMERVTIAYDILPQHT